MSEVDGATLVAMSLTQQGVKFMFGIIWFPVGPIAMAAQREGITYVGVRNEQSASYAAQAVWLSDRAARRLPRRVGPRRRPRPGRPRQCAAQWLADHPHRRRVGVLAQRHGGVPGGAPGADRDAVLQVRARGRARHGLGHLAVQYLAKWGCDVTAVSSSRDKEEHARRLGATQYIRDQLISEMPIAVWPWALDVFRLP
jgi:Thiamine pyrophosphate enzyme, N-terminal TPP binding domain/Zinc-binding dehydrogenase